MALNLHKLVQKAQILNVTVNNKIKGTVVEKWVVYWKAVIRDYKDVVLSLKDDAKEKPLKATGVILGLTLLGISFKTNPNEQSFRAKYIECANYLGLVHPLQVNQLSSGHLKYIERCHNADLLRYKSFGIFSVILVDNYGDKSAFYESQSKYLKWSYTSVFDHLIDVGFWNIWWGISRKMLNYDINY